LSISQFAGFKLSIDFNIQLISLKKIKMKRAYMKKEEKEQKKTKGRKREPQKFVQII